MTTAQTRLSRHRRLRPSVSKIVAAEYDMYVMPIHSLLALDRLLPHEVVLSKGLLQPWTYEMDKKVIFVSHQWLGFNHPDPENQQFPVLKTLLTNLLNGQVPNMDELLTMFSYATRDVTALKKYLKSMTSEKWKATVAESYVWIDYMSMPQPSAAAQMAQGFADIETAWWTPQNTEGTASVTADHRFETAASAAAAKSAADLQKAVRSIPVYVDRCFLMLVLVPLCRHVDLDVVCDFCSWRSRGWCRMELASAFLSRTKMRIVVCRHATRPFFTVACDAVMLAAGEGEYTCCLRGHCIDGKPIPCDKMRVKYVLEEIVNRNIEFARISGKVNTLMNDLVFRCRYLAGLPDCELVSDSAFTECTSVEEFQAELGWSAGVTPSSSSSLPCSKCGQIPNVDARTLAVAIAMGADTIVQELLDRNVNTNSRVTLDVGVPFDSFGCTPVMIALGFGSLSTARLLLERHADPNLRTTKLSLTTLHYAASLGRADSVSFWLKQFPACDVNVSSRFGMTPLHMCCLHPRGAPVAEILLSGRADVDYKTYAGATPLMMRCSHMHDCDLELVRLLVQSTADVNAPCKPTSCIISIAASCSRMLFALGCRVAPVKVLANVDGATPMHGAARRLDIATVRQLMQLGGLQLPNRIGCIPLGSCLMNHGEIPPLLLQVVEGDGSVTQNDIVHALLNEASIDIQDEFTDVPDGVALSSTSDNRIFSARRDYEFCVERFIQL